MDRSSRDIFKQIQTNFLQDTDLVPADVAIVFGNKHISGELAAKTAALFHAGMVRKGIVVTGGVHGANDLEAYELYDTLVKAGVPDNFIMVDDLSTNTQENTQNARDRLRDTIGLEEIDSVISIGHAYAGPRFLMTVAKHMPHVLPMHVQVYPKGLTRENCMADTAFATRMGQEIEKITFYLNMQYIAPITVPEINALVQQHRLENTPVFVRNVAASLQEASQSPLADSTVALLLRRPVSGFIPPSP